MLASHGADLRVTNNKGQTPLFYSIAIGQWGDMSRELLTIGMLISLENNIRAKHNWASLKDVASKAYNPREKQQILTLLDQLEKTQSGISQGNNLEKTVIEIIDRHTKDPEGKNGVM